MLFLAVFLSFFLSVDAYAAQGNALPAQPERLTGDDGAEMVLIPAGEFVMGSEDEDLKEIAPEHKVHVDAFYMDKYEVTNDKFAKFLNASNIAEGPDSIRLLWLVIRNDIEAEERALWWPTEIAYENGMYVATEGFESHPVITVNWFAADGYCRWAGKRLPTEAEWEKAARGKLERKAYPWGNEIPTGGVIFDMAWHDNIEPSPARAVGNYHPNGYGLFDMVGNVWEWCSDWYDKSYYKKSPRKNPKGPDSGDLKVLRGGSWFNSYSYLRVAYRNSGSPDSTNDGVGFRCVMDARSPNAGK